MQIPVIIHHHAMLGLRSFSNSFVYMANKKIWTRGRIAEVANTQVSSQPINSHLVGGFKTILKTMSSSMGRIIPYIKEHKKKCLKPDFPII